MLRLRVAAVLVVLLLAAVPLGATGCEFDLFPGVDYPADANPLSLATADFNNDGRPDLAARSGFSQNVKILIASAGGGFLPPTTVTVARSIYHDISAGDVDGDGKADLLVPTIQGGDSYGDMNFIKGNGDGTFQTPVPVEVFQNPSGSVLGHFNGDAYLDVAATKGTGFVVFAGSPNGISVLADVDLGGNIVATPDEITAGDFDEDGNLDVAFSFPSTEKIYVYYGNGAGAFTAGPILSMRDGYFGYALTAGDYDGDGDADIAFGEDAPDGTPAVEQLVLYRSNGAPRTFAAPVGSGEFEDDGAPLNEATTVDIDHDGDLDVIVAASYQFKLFLNDATGTFTAVPLTSPAYGMAVGDFDRDGGLDLAGSNFDPVGKIRVFTSACGHVGLTLTSSKNPSIINETVNFTATVVPPPAVAPTGTLTLLRAGNVIAVRNLSTSLTLPKAISDLPLGQTDIQADYSGDSRFASASILLTQMVELPPFGPPTQVVASSTGGPPTVSWLGTRDVNHYQIWRRSTGGDWVLAGTDTASPFTDTTAPAAAGHVYKVQGMALGGSPSGFSASDLASTFTFTNETITVRSTRIQLAHLTELRNAANAARSAAGLSAITWAEASPVVVKASHWVEVLNAVDSARTGVGMAGSGLTAPAVGGVVERALVIGLRVALR